ncbi:hypothetical protein BBP40_007688 [Aspergillus hancockii]|nr:hypothetical protein BBP40_007688 [Aspergillus hancockii]
MPPKRKNPSDGPDGDDTRRKRYTYLEPHVRRVSERTIKTKWSTLPEPMQNKDSVFEYEAALKEHCSLEASLATVTDSVHLLNAEIEKEEALLAKETKQLQEMEKNAKRAEAERKRQLKNEHPVLRQLNASSQQNQEHTQFILGGEKTSQTTFDELEADPEVVGLLKQLKGHLKSMQNNTAPLTGLSEAITRSQAALALASLPED